MSNVDIMTKWVKTSIRRIQTLWLVEEITSLYCNAAFKTRKRPKSKVIHSLRS